MAKRWILRIVTLAVWATAGLAASFWALRFAGSSAAAPSAAMAPEPVAAREPADLAIVFGPSPAPASAAVADVASTPRPVDPAARFALVGVVAGRANAGVALISIEGKAARPYPVGSRIDSYTLKSVASKSATLVPSAKADAPFTLELAAPGRPATASTAPLAATPTGTAPSGTAATSAAPTDDDSAGAAPTPAPVPSPRLRQGRPAPRPTPAG